MRGSASATADSSDEATRVYLAVVAGLAWRIVTCCTLRSRSCWALTCRSSAGAGGGGRPAASRECQRGRRAGPSGRHRPLLTGEPRRDPLGHRHGLLVAALDGECPATIGRPRLCWRATCAPGRPAAAHDRRGHQQGANSRVGAAVPRMAVTSDTAAAGYAAGHLDAGHLAGRVVLDQALLRPGGKHRTMGEVGRPGGARACRTGRRRSRRRAWAWSGRRTPPNRRGAADAERARWLGGGRGRAARATPTAASVVMTSFGIMPRPQPVDRYCINSVSLRSTTRRGPSPGPWVDGTRPVSSHSPGTWSQCPRAGTMRSFLPKSCRCCSRWPKPLSGLRAWGAGRRARSRSPIVVGRLRLCAHVPMFGLPNVRNPVALTGWRNGPKWLTLDVDHRLTPV